jgi:hypothetical protein
MKTLHFRGEHPALLADQPLCVLHGTDSLQAIRMPDGAPIADAQAAISEWRTALSKLGDGTQPAEVDPHQYLASLPPEPGAIGFCV